MNENRDLYIIEVKNGFVVIDNRKSRSRHEESLRYVATDAKDLGRIIVKLVENQ